MQNSRHASDWRQLESAERRRSIKGGRADKKWCLFFFKMNLIEWRPESILQTALHSSQIQLTLFYPLIDAFLKIRSEIYFTELLALLNNSQSEDNKMF